MAVYSTMIRDDPDSRARLRVTPEQALNFPNFHCLASWIAGGTRIPSFMGQTYPWPRHSDAWANAHLARLADRVEPYSDELNSTLEADPRPQGEPNQADGPTHEVVAEAPAAAPRSVETRGVQDGEHSPRAQLAHAVEHVGLVGALRRISGSSAVANDQTC
ncbi:MAG: hypothetical protein ACLP8S_16015 [Solirubrobacteraceae bacterium]